MNRAYPAFPVIVARHPLHGILAAFPIACFTLALVNDVAYWQSSNLVWKHFAEWLLFYGIVGGVLALVVGLLDTLLRKRPALSGPIWPHALGSLAALVLATINSFVHSGDGWTAVVPYGLVLSAATVMVTLLTEWIARPVAFHSAAE